MTRPADPSAAPRRVLFVADEIVTAGAGTESQLLRLIAGLSGSRFEPHLAVFRQSDFVASGGVPCPVHHLDIARIATPVSLPRLVGLARLVRRLDAAVSHTWFNDAAIAAPAFCRLAGARVVGSRRDMGFWYTGPILKALCVGNAFVDVIVTNSDAVRANVHRREGFPLERIAVIGNGHALGRFSAAPAPRLRERLGIPVGDAIIGMVANLNARKRHADLVSAVARVRGNGWPAHVILVGSGPEHTALTEQAASLGVAEAVHIVEGVTDAVPLVKHFDVAVLCSESEGFSNALLEYAFCQRPIVCTNVGGNPELIRHDVSGLLLDVGNVAGLASALTSLLADGDRARALGSAAEQTARAGFSAEAMAAAHLALYDRLLAHPRAAVEARRTS